jgi:hypothetical protein
MGCLTQNYSNNCAVKTIGGLRTVYIASKTDVTGVTGGNGSPVTAVTMDGSTTFYKFEFRRDEASFEETSQANGSVTQTLNFNVRGRSQDLRNRIQELIDCTCGLVIIHVENTGDSWIWGFEDSEEAYWGEGTGGSGLAKTDPNQEVINLVASATEKCNTFTGTPPL